MRNPDALLVTPVLLIGLGFLGGASEACGGSAAPARSGDPATSAPSPATGDTNAPGTSTPSSSAPSLTVTQAARSAYAHALTNVSSAIGNDVNSGPACARPVAADPPTELCAVLSQIQGKSRPFFFAGVRNDVSIPWGDTEVSVDVVFDLQNLQAASFLRTSSTLDENVLAGGDDAIGAGASAKGQGYLGFAFGASADASLASAWSTSFSAAATAAANADAASFFSYDAEASAFCDPTQSLCGSSADARVCLNLDVDVSVPTLLLSAALPGLPWDAVTAQLAAHAHAEADASASASASSSFQPALTTMTDASGSSFVQFAGGASLAYSLADAIGSSGSDAWLAASIAIALDVQRQTGLSYGQLCGSDAGAGSDAGESSSAPPSSTSGGSFTVR